MPAVISAYRFHMFELAGQFESRDALDCLYTVMPRSLVKEVNPKNVASHPTRALIRNGLERVFGPQESLNWMVVNDFDSWCSRNLGVHDITVHASSFSTMTMRHAKAKGSITICDRGAQHIAVQKQLLSEERARLGLSPPKFDNRLVQRELEEYQLADAIVVPSESALRSYIAQGIPSEKVHRIPYGVDATRFVPLDLEARDLRRVLCVGALDPQKGQQYLVEAFSRVPLHDIRMELLGARNDKTFLSKIATGDPRIIYSDPIPRAAVPTTMARAGIFALMSVQDGFGMVVAQAMACGLPVVVSDSVGASDIVNDGHNGFIVPSGDVERLQEVLTMLLSDPELIQVMGQRARRKALSLGGWRSYGTEYLSLCDRLGAAK